MKPRIKKLELVPPAQRASAAERRKVVSIEKLARRVDVAKKKIDKGVTAAEKRALARAVYEAAKSDEQDVPVPEPHRGQSVLFDWELANKILDGVAAGETLHVVCQRLDICETTIRNWVLDDRGADEMADPPKHGFAQSYARARLLQSEAWSDHIIGIADDVFESAEAIQKAKFRVEVRKWIMGKNNPQRFGERATVALETPEPLRMVTANMTPQEAAEVYTQHLRQLPPPNGG